MAGNEARLPSWRTAPRAGEDPGEVADAGLEEDGDGGGGEKEEEPGEEGGDSASDGEDPDFGGRRDGGGEADEEETNKGDPEGVDQDLAGAETAPRQVEVDLDAEPPGVAPRGDAAGVRRGWGRGGGAGGVDVDRSGRWLLEGGHCGDRILLQ